jgi:hypothetical protein
MITNFNLYKESLRNKMTGPKLSDEFTKTPEGLKKYIQHRLHKELNADESWLKLRPISDLDYDDFKDKIPNRDLAFTFNIMACESMVKDIKEYIRDVGYDVSLVKRINWGDDHQYIIVAKEKK